VAFASGFAGAEACLSLCRGCVGLEARLVGRAAESPSAVVDVRAGVRNATTVVLPSDRGKD